MQDGGKIAVRKRVDVDGGDLTDARAGTNGQTGEWVVNFKFNSNGARRFADITRANVNHRFAIVLDDKVISAPVIREPITAGSGEISGGFSAASSNDLAVLLRAGALPAPLTVVEERTIGPELGADSIRAGAISLLAGFLPGRHRVHGFLLWPVRLVREFMFAGEPGADAGVDVVAGGNADVARNGGDPADAWHGGGCEYPDQRTHPWEQKRGRPPLQALEHGFRRAYSTIFDSAATFLSHVMLFVFGSGPVKGFAGDDHHWHRDIDVHGLDADATIGIAMVYRRSSPASAGFED